MKGFIKQTAAAVCLGASVVALIGCQHYREVVDPCWPERYSQSARESVRDMHNAQADKGHLLDHTLWAADFNGNELKPSGKAKLKYIANREPVAVVMKVYLQNAESEEDAAKRSATNAARKKAILAHLSSQNWDDRKTIYEVEVHNYAQPTHLSDWTNKALEGVEKNIKAGTPQTFVSPSSSSSSSSGSR